MRKKCTNSSCRRTFTVEAVNKVSCPHCGRVYPRLFPVCRNWSVLLLNPGCSRLGVIRVIRRHTGYGFKETKFGLVDVAPSIIKTGLSFEEASMISEELAEAGASAMAKQLTFREARSYATV